MEVIRYVVVFIPNKKACGLNKVSWEYMFADTHSPQGQRTFVYEDNCFKTKDQAEQHIRKILQNKASYGMDRGINKSNFDVARVVLSDFYKKDREEMAKRDIPGCYEMCDEDSTKYPIYKDPQEETRVGALVDKLIKLRNADSQRMKANIERKMQ